MKVFAMAAWLAAGAAVSGGAPAPALKIEKAVYQLDPGVVQVAFEFDNPTDSVLYLDCQGRPRAAGKGGALSLSFGNVADTLAEAAEAPARVGPRQVFKAARKLYAKTPGRESPAIELDPTGFAKLRLEIAYYPERGEGEGSPWLKERAAFVVSKPVVMEKRGKRPPPLPVTKTRTYTPPPAQADSPEAK
jgi:hypothetical protein